MSLEARNELILIHDLINQARDIIKGCDSMPRRKDIIDSIDVCLRMAKDIINGRARQ